METAKQPDEKTAAQIGSTIAEQMKEDTEKRQKQRHQMAKQLDSEKKDIATAGNRDNKGHQ